MVKDKPIVTRTITLKPRGESAPSSSFYLPFLLLLCPYSSILMLLYNYCIHQNPILSGYSVFDEINFTIVVLY